VHPKVLLMDEPFSALDVLTAETLRTDLLDLWAEDVCRSPRSCW
jgi:NitT/TauT family transport system ATP-binding protein